MCLYYNAVYSAMCLCYKFVYSTMCLCYNVVYIAMCLCYNSVTDNVSVIQCCAQHNVCFTMLCKCNVFVLNVLCCNVSCSTILCCAQCKMYLCYNDTMLLCYYMGVFSMVQTKPENIGSVLVHILQLQR